MPTEKCNELIGNRTRDLPAYSIVPKPTTLPRASKCEHKEIILNLSLIYWSHFFCYLMTLIQFHNICRYGRMVTKKQGLGRKRPELIGIYCPNFLQERPTEKTVTSWRISGVSVVIWNGTSKSRLHRG
jgi:hypothetical protein